MTHAERIKHNARLRQQGVILAHASHALTPNDAPLNFLAPTRNPLIAANVR